MPAPVSSTKRKVSCCTFRKLKYASSCKEEREREREIRRVVRREKKRKIQMMAQMGKHAVSVNASFPPLCVCIKM